MDLLCRTCLNKTSMFASTNIYNELNYYSQSCKISSIIMACAPVEISEGDGLPSVICENCLKLLHISFMFRISVLQANQKLKNHLETNILVPIVESIRGDLTQQSASTLIGDAKHVTSQQIEDEIDPLSGDPNDNSGIDIKTEISNEIQPIEEVLLPSLPLYETTESDESYCNIQTQKIINSSQSKSNSNVLENSQIICNNSSGVQANANTNPFILSQADSQVIHNAIVQSNQNVLPGSKFILIKMDQVGNIFTENAPGQNLPGNIVQVQHQQNVHSLNENRIAPTTSREEKSSVNVTEIINKKRACFDNVNTKLSFEDELKKFVLEKHNRPGSSTFISLPESSVTKISEPPSIDLTSEDMVSELVHSKNGIDETRKTRPFTADFDVTRQIRTYNIKHMKRLKNSPISNLNRSILKESAINKNENNMFRICINEDQSTSVVIDD